MSKAKALETTMDILNAANLSIKPGTESSIANAQI